MAARLILVIDTATRTGVLGLANAGGQLIANATWKTAHRHGEELLSRLDGLLEQAGAQPADIGAIVVGTGPGSFTGLRIGLATAKTLAYGLSVALVGVPTGHGLALGATDGGDVTVMLPAGANDRYRIRLRVAAGVVEELSPPELVASSRTVEEPTSVTAVAVDIDPAEASEEASAVGRRAVEGLAGALARLGSAAIAAGRRDDVAELVPAYVALPRGIAQAAASVEWSPDLR